MKTSNLNGITSFFSKNVFKIAGTIIISVMALAYALDVAGADSLSESIIRNTEMALAGMFWVMLIGWLLIPFARGSREMIHDLINR